MDRTEHTESLKGWVILALAAVLAYTAFQWGGVERTGRYGILLALGLLAMIRGQATLSQWRRLQHGPGTGYSVPSEARGQSCLSPFLLLPAYVLLQVVPLPVAALRVLSPARAQMVDALVPVGAGEHAWFLIRQGQPEAASLAWARPVGPFDWSLARSAGVEIARDDKEGSLRISFAGTENLEIAAASQLVFVRPGTYRFRARIRTDGVTTDQGIRFRIADAEVPACLNLTFGQFTGSSPWSDVQQELIVPPQTRLLQVQVIRQPSMRFDNRIGGTAWIDGVKLTRMASPGSERR